MNTATPLGARGRSVIGGGQPVVHPPDRSVELGKCLFMNESCTCNKPLYGVRS